MKINWKLDLVLSLFGLFMAIGTVFFIPFQIEPFFWLVIFILVAYLVAKYTLSGYFLNGITIGILNSFWIIAVHELFFDTYKSNHLEYFKSMPAGGMDPKLAMLVFGLLIGVVSGLVIGLFCFIAAKIMKKA